MLKSEGIEEIRDKNTTSINAGMVAPKEASYDEKREVFCAWLKEHGARYPKIQWPSLDTVGGCRGAKAIETIESNEVMMEIPVKLMMSPLHAFADPVVGQKLEASQDLLRGDILLTVYIMSEILKGDDSFYAPFLAILPEPGSIVQWTQAELDMLQDSAMTYKAKTRKRMLRTTYDRNVSTLCDRYPSVFPSEKYTHELFLFAWFCVQARAFGRRLPWTALVPFADCLNHSNVQTKYDYDVDGNGLFRMMPTGTNCYPKGCEVFNSYGRRPNDNLLLDYGFSILDNQWDELSMSLALTPKLYSRKKRILFHMGFHIHSTFSIQRAEFPLDALAFARLDAMSAAELEKAEDWFEGTPDRHGPYSLRVQNIQLELKAITRVKNGLLILQQDWDTSADDDAALLQKLHSNEWKLVSAVTYRLTRKRIVDAVMEKLETVETYLRALFVRRKAHAMTNAVASVTGESVFNTRPTKTPTQSPSRSIWDDIQRIDFLYGGKSHSGGGGASPYVSSGTGSSFRPQSRRTETRSNEARLRAFIQAITNEALPST
eukprot:GSChrysophyteH1.ASY1.ANO1.3035.1 assembled CDS